MADMEDRRATIAERAQESDEPRHGLRIVAPLAGGFPFVEGALHVDDNEGGLLGHGSKLRSYTRLRHHTANAIITAPASVNQVMAYCRWSSRKCTCSGPGFGMPFGGTGVSRSM